MFVAIAVHLAQFVHGEFQNILIVFPFFWASDSLVWLYHRFLLRPQKIREVFIACGITETIWCS